MKVIPPNFGYVEDGVFRCGAPEPRHYGFLASLGLRTCILLTDTHDAAFVHWLQETGVMIFCPLSNEAQTRGTVRTTPNVYNTVHVSDNMGFPPTRSSAGGGGGLPSTSSVHTNNNNHTNDGREDVASPNGGQGETYGSTIGSGGFGPVGDAPHPAALQHSNEGNDGGGDNGEGGVDNSGNFNGDDTHASATHPNINLSIGGGARGGAGWANASTTTGATPGTSNAVRFLQENVVERQMNTKFSPVLVQEPVYFPGGSRTDNGRGGNGGGGGGGGGGTTSSGGGGGPYQFVSAPSYEGRLHGLMTLSEAVVVSILHILLDPQYYPLLITCSKGRYRSGIVCGCLRKLQGWNLVSILEEYRRFAGNKSRADNEEFIELFDEDLVNLELADGRRPTILYNM